MEVLKLGVIQTTLDLSFKNYHVIGRSFSCDIYLSHDSVSLFHAIFQFRRIPDSENEAGIYIYDLGNNNGTFLNGNRLKPNIYILVHGGDMITFGNCSKKYVLQTPRDDEEKEAQLTTAELKEIEQLEQEAEEKLILEKLLREKEELLEREENSRKFNWNIENLDDDSMPVDSSESSEFEESDNEDMFLADPRKALRHWFKWEGHDLEYHTEDRGFGKYYCYIDLILDIKGTSERVQVDVIGDKMKAIEECALKACRVLHGYGFLKKAHEEEKSVTRNWEAADYYDSDEDNFLDRTGIIERKRQKRMQMTGKLKTEPETADTLEMKHSDIIQKISILQKLLASQNMKQINAENSNEDDLDTFMSKLDTASLNKSETLNVKMELNNLYREKAIIINAIDAVRKITSAGSSKVCLPNINEKTKNGCRYNE